jgi:hypothetical protein
VLGHVHAGIGGTQDRVLGGTVFRIERDAHACRTRAACSYSQ